MIKRRNFIGGIATLGTALTVSGCDTLNESTKVSRKLDFSKPEDNLYGLMKLMGDISGKRTYYYQPGRVFLHRAGSLPLHLMNYTGATAREIQKINDKTYMSRYSGWQLFRDAVTNEVIDDWTNPVTGEKTRVEHFEFAKSKQTFSEDGLKRPKNYDGDFSWFDRSFILPWQIIGDSVWAPYEQFSRYTNRAGHKRYENAIHTYHGSVADLENETLKNAPSSIASQSQSPFYHWMGFRDMDGHLISTSLGKKSDNLDIYPSEFRDAIKSRYPGAFDVTFDWET